MIITLISVLVLVLGVIILKKFDKHEYEFCGMFLTVFGVVFTIICVSVIILTHAFGVRDAQINELKYQGLCERLEVVTKSDYEHVSKSELIKDITEWNVEVQSIKYWNANPMTNWFIPDVVADNVRYLSYPIWEE